MVRILNPNSRVRICHSSRFAVPQTKSTSFSHRKERKRSQERVKRSQNRNKQPEDSLLVFFLLKFNTSLALDHPPIQKVDMIIAITTRATRGDENYQKTKDVISSIIDEFGRERIHYGVLLFGKPPQITVRLGDYHDTDDKLMAVINNFPPDKSNADLAEVKLIMRL